MRDVLPVVLAVLALVAGSSSLGCAESRDPLPPGSRDADTGAIDAIFGSDAGATPPRSAEASMGDGAACLDFEDNDLNGLMDCEEQDCRSSAVSASCCVGRTDEACCTTERVDEVTGSGAAPATLHLRDQTLTTMGGTVYPGAILTTCDVRVDAAFAPIGNDSLSGYLALPSGYAPRSGYLTIEARIGLEEREVGEPAAAGFGIFSSDGLGPIARPLVAVVVSGAGREVRVVEGDRVVASRALGVGACASSMRYRLRLTPEGSYEVYAVSPGAEEPSAPPIFTGRTDPRASVRVAMFGQQRNPDTAPLAWVSDLRVIERGCDRLAPDRRPRAVLDEGAHDVTDLAIFPRFEPDPSPEADPPGYEALVLSDGHLYWMAIRSSDGGLASAVSGVPFANELRLDWPGSVRITGLAVALSHGEHQVFLAATVDGSGPAIYRTTYTPSMTAGQPGSLGAAPTRVADETMLGREGAISIDAPSALFVPIVDRVVLVGRVRFSDGHSELRILPTLAMDGEIAATPAVGRDPAGVTTQGLLRANAWSTETAFDRDEVSDPQLFEVNGVVRVLYAGRRGTRWSIGEIVASPDFTHFIPVDAEPLLAPSGDGFDALGVRAPRRVRRGGVDWLYFLGTDGTTQRVGLATQPVVSP